MARTRNPNRDRAYELWQKRGGKIANREIAAALGEDEKKIAVWKQRDKWSVVQQSESVVQQKKDCCTTQKPKKKRGGQPGNGNAKGHGAPPGNKNAVGNRGGAPMRNTNAVKTGEYQTLWLAYLSDDERLAYENIDVEKLRQVDEDIRLLTWRENLMMKRIHELRNGIDNVEIETVEEMRPKQQPIPVYDESVGETKQKTTVARQLEIKEIRKKEKSLLGEILRIEEALTRVQDKKAKLLQIKHKLEIDHERLELERRRVEILEIQAGDFENSDEADDAQTYIDALSSKVPEVWNNGN